MLVMIRPIDRFQLSPPLKSSHTLRAPRVCQNDILTSAAPSQRWKKMAHRLFPNFKKYAFKVLETVWNWVKYNVFFFIFDEKKEKNDRIAAELDKFANTYYEIGHSDEGKKDIQVRYKFLSVDARKLIEKKLEEMITSMELPLTLDKILDDPFITVDREGKSIGLLCDACLVVRDTLNTGE